jgi:hypothetical protein
MTRSTLALAITVAFLAVAPAARAAATRIPGGGDPATDCFVEYEALGDATTVPGAPTQVVCTDCDPSCDKDGVPVANGSCTFELALCLGQDEGSCLTPALRKVRAHRRQLVVPDLASKECGPFTANVLRARPEGVRPKTRRVRVKAITDESPRRLDSDELQIVCLPRPAGEACPVSVHAPCADADPLRHAYFGDLHIHTRNSFDAASFKVVTTPRQAYQFAKGATVLLPPLDANGTGTRPIQIDRPLDFAAVTDHSEFLGEIEQCTTPGAAGYDSTRCVALRTDPIAGTVGFGVMLTPVAPARDPAICGPDGTGCIPAADSVWDRIQLAADAEYDRSAACAFTTFVAYEYTAATNVSTNHRNVIFRNTHVPFPTTTFEQPTPQGLWNELKVTCLDAGTGCDVLAIPHNSNESNGRMFQVEYPGVTTTAEEEAAALFRSQMEPVLEIYQHKGDSECRNGLSGIIGAPDELCDFEKEFRPDFTDCGDGVGTGGSARIGCISRRDFARGILLEGLAEEERLGVNPYQLGFIGSTDTHNGTPGAVVEQGFMGHRGVDDDTPALRLGRGQITLGGISFSPGGLAGVWAEENSRDAIFDALRRREVFATSGPRIVPRFFGGWSLPAGLCSDPNMIASAYAGGVPMGGVLPPPPPATAPTFLVSALKDAGTVARPGTPLQRIQIVKGWREGGQSHVQVYDVAGDPNDGATVDDTTCETSGPGFDSLCGLWTDPDFDPAEHAYYYARVVENPTCRWSAWECNALGVDCSDPGSVPAEYANCCSPDFPRTIQERAWTSPIYYTPAG